MARDPGMMDLRKFPLLNAKEWRFLEENRIERLNWINMTKEQRWAILLQAMK